jgi:A/G-specific adenine glycosylase
MIWVSEIMLQQTRVAAATPYFERFVARFPTVEALAQASKEELLACWAGLGYYTRAHNIQRAAQAIVAAGAFPTEYSAIRGLPGIGDYTAAAIASIAFGLPHAAVDGNVLRVLSRLCGDESDIGQPKNRKHFAALAHEMLDKSNPGEFNQAVMELGATLCLPRNPQCLLCPVRSYCQASMTGQQNRLPVKGSKEQRQAVKRRVFWIEYEERVLAWQRNSEERLMPGFWELPESQQLPQAEGEEVLARFRHSITYHDYHFEVVRVKPTAQLGNCVWLQLSVLDHLPLSTIFRKAISAISRTR